LPSVELRVRPEGDVRPGVVTDDRYCLINGPTNQYVYTPAWVNKVVREVGRPRSLRRFSATRQAESVAIVADRNGCGPPAVGELIPLGRR